MKKLSIAAVVLFSLGLATFVSCDKVKDLAKVTINLDNADGMFTIPVIPAAGTASLGSAEVYINLDSIIKAQNAQISAANIKEVHIKTCQLVMIDGDKSNNFSALESCVLKVKSNTKPEVVTIAEVAGNPDTEAYTLNLPVNSGLELKDYFVNANTFTYSISGTARKATTKPVKCQVKITYSILAGL